MVAARAAQAPAVLGALHRNYDALRRPRDRPSRSRACAAAAGLALVEGLTVAYGAPVTRACASSWRRPCSWASYGAFGAAVPWPVAGYGDVGAPRAPISLPFGVRQLAFACGLFANCVMLVSLNGPGNDGRTPGLGKYKYNDAVVRYNDGNAELIASALLAAAAALYASCLVYRLCARAPLAALRREREIFERERVAQLRARARRRAAEPGDPPLSPPPSPPLCAGRRASARARSARRSAARSAARTRGRARSRAAQ